MSNFNFLKSEWPEIFESAIEAEKHVFSSPRISCFFARRAMELGIYWLYDNDRDIRRPEKDSLAALIFERTFKEKLNPSILPKLDLIRKIGNKAVHDFSPVSDNNSVTLVRELFHFLFWLYRFYSVTETPQDHQFNPDIIPRTPAVTYSLQQVQELEQKLSEKDRKLSEQEEKYRKTVEELELVRKRRDELMAVPDRHDYNEALTRKVIIDELLREAGWNPDAPNVREYRVNGMPNNTGEGFADYVLWGKDGKPLAVIEAKNTMKNASTGRGQAALYANCLETMTGQRPVIFYTNGYETFIWDDVNYGPRPVHGFYTEDDLERMIQRRKSRKDIKKPEIDQEIVGRYYQNLAINQVFEHFSNNNRKALVVMATGTGKTRTTIALVDILLKNNWVKNVLFLADRNALVKQAYNAFKKHLPSASIEILKRPDQLPHSSICFSTYPTMINCLDETRNNKKIFSAGHFDLIIVDEAHRSIYQKYGAIFNYFDSLLLGLTATPRDEVDHNTYNLFECRDGMPVYYYEPEQAFSDKYLVRPKVFSVKMKFHQEGIRYNELSKAEKEEYEEKLYDEETDDIPTGIDPTALNKWLFNRDTVVKVLEHLMENGLKVSGGDRIGKTIIFAKNHNHAEFILKVFEENYPFYKGHFARVIDNYNTYAQDTLEEFSKKETSPHIAISVDMLDTGVDVPEIVNLVFFKIIRSKTKFYQMIGRGTRLCEDLFAPGNDKKEFLIFDFCENFEFFELNPEGYQGKAAMPISRQIFLNKLKITRLLEGRKESQKNNSSKVAETQAEYIADPLETVKEDLLESLHQNIMGMNTENFIVRPKRMFVEKYRIRDNWKNTDQNFYHELADHVSGLPSESNEDHEKAKRFDLLIFNLEIALMEKSDRFNLLKEKARDLISSLEEKQTIPEVKNNLELIMEVQNDSFWENINLQVLENLRKKLRHLIKVIDGKEKKDLIYIDFEDEIMDIGTPIAKFGSAGALQRYREQVQKFISQHKNHTAIHKLINNIPITPTDLEALENILYSAEELKDRETFEQAFGKQEKLGVFIRSLTGLDRNAAKEAFAEYLPNNTFSAKQITFINDIIDYLTKSGVMNPKLLYQPPFTEYSALGIEGLFEDGNIDNIIGILKNIEKNAIA